jgi:phosphoglycerate dehydrogenase-like enzyme
MAQSLPEIINVLLVATPDGQRRARVQAVAPNRLKVTEIPPADFALDAGELWPPGRGTSGPAVSSREERDAALRDAQAILLNLPYPTSLYSRTHNLLWMHHPNAGASNLHRSDFWGAPVMVTTSRGANAALPIAESVVAGALMFARGLHVAARGSFERRDYAGNVSLAGKTMGIVGLGGIGGHVARLAGGLGMRVVATRRSATTRHANVDGVDELFPATELHLMLAQSDYVAVCAMLTEETERMFDAPAFAAMKEGAVLINIARGEIIDEPAMVAALASGKLRGAYLDVFAGELSGNPPPPELRDHPNVVITPHISGMADNPGPLGFDLFLANLRRFIAGEPLSNVIDWQRGY